jgi:hypothetical protein
MDNSPISSKSFSKLTANINSKKKQELMIRSQDEYQNKEFQTFFMNKIKNLRSNSNMGDEHVMKILNEIDEKNKQNNQKHEQNPLTKFLKANMNQSKIGSETSFQSNGKEISNRTNNTSKNTIYDDKQTMKAKPWRKSPELDDNFPETLEKHVNNFRIFNLNDKRPINEVDLIDEGLKSISKPFSRMNNIDENAIFDVEQINYKKHNNIGRALNYNFRKNFKNKHKKMKLTKIRSFKDLEPNQRGYSHKKKNLQNLKLLQQKNKLIKDLIKEDEKEKAISIDYIDIEKVDSIEKKKNKVVKKKRLEYLPKPTQDISKFLKSKLFKYSCEIESYLNRGLDEGYPENPYFKERIKSSNETILCGECEGLLIKGNQCSSCQTNFCGFCFFKLLDMDSILNSVVNKEEVIDEDNGFKCKCGNKLISQIDAGIKKQVKGKYFIVL